MTLVAINNGLTVTQSQVPFQKPTNNEPNNDLTKTDNLNDTKLINTIICEETKTEDKSDNLLPNLLKDHLKQYDMDRDVGKKVHIIEYTTASDRNKLAKKNTVDTKPIETRDLKRFERPKPRPKQLTRVELRQQKRIREERERNELLRQNLNKDESICQLICEGVYATAIFIITCPLLPLKFCYYLNKDCCEDCIDRAIDQAQHN